EHAQLHDEAAAALLLAVQGAQFASTLFRRGPGVTAAGLRAIGLAVRHRSSSSGMERVRENTTRTRQRANRGGPPCDVREPIWEPPARILSTAPLSRCVILAGIVGTDAGGLSIHNGSSGTYLPVKENETSWHPSLSTRPPASIPVRPAPRSTRSTSRSKTASSSCSSAPPAAASPRPCACSPASMRSTT